MPLLLTKMIGKSKNERGLSSCVYSTNTEGAPALYMLVNPFLCLHAGNALLKSRLFPEANVFSGSEASVYFYCGFMPVYK